MIHSNDVKYSCTFAGIVTVIILFVQSYFFKIDFLSAISTAVTITTILRFIFLKWLWKWRIFNFLEFVHQVPLIEGVWKGQYQSTWKPPGDTSPISGDVEVVIKQPNLYELKITQETNEGPSLSYCESIKAQEDGSFLLNFSYLNVPKATFVNKSPISYGTARYILKRVKKSMTLAGDYFTSRQTTGSVTLKLPISKNKNS